MGIFGNSSPFDEDVERATSENNTHEDWALILEICDRAGAGAAAARDALRAVTRRLAHADPHVALQAATLLDACVHNSGRVFLLEVASRDFEAEFRRLVARAQPPVAARLRAMLRKWAEGEFRDDPQLDLIPSLHARLRSSSGAAAAAADEPRRAEPSPSAAAAAAAREQDDLARAIALSLRESGPAAATAAPAAAPAAPSASLYPSVDAPLAPAPAPTLRDVRALYDFEAAEDNELTFYAGEIVHVTDSSDPNWWKGHNERGEGLFPANFVTGDLAAATEPSPAAPAARAGGKSVQFSDGAGPGEEEEAAAGAGVDEAALDAALAWLHEASPEAPGAPHEEEAAARRERAALRAGALIDAALQRADSRHASLSQLSHDLVDALNLYHDLMRAPPAPHPAPAPPPPPALYYPAPPPAPR